MSKEMLLICQCERRYVQREVLCAVAEQGREQCRCGELLGAWDGPVRLQFEPEANDD